MTVNEIIMNAIKNVGYTAYADTYIGNDHAYITFNFADERGIKFEDDEEILTRYSMQIHLFCPKDYDYTQLKKDIKKELKKSRFSGISIQNLYESETKKRHIIFECDIDLETEE
jgi:hypothetical protein